MTASTLKPEPCRRGYRDIVQLAKTPTTNDAAKICSIVTCSIGQRVCAKSSHQKTYIASNMRQTPSDIQDFVSSVLLSVLSVALLPVSLAAVGGCIAKDLLSGEDASVRVLTKRASERKSKGTVMISGGKMTKSLTCVRALVMPSSI